MSGFSRFRDLNSLNKFIFRDNRFLTSAAENHDIALSKHIVAIFEFHRRENIRKFFGICKSLTTCKNLGRIFLYILEHQRTHFAKTHDIYSTIFKIIKSLLHLLHRQERNIATELAQVRLSLDALCRMNRALEKLVQRIARCIQLVRRLVRTTNLVQNLIFTHGDRIKTGTHIHHMVCNIVTRLKIKELRKIIVVLTGKSTHITNEFTISDFAVARHIDFRAVTRCQNQKFIKRRMRQRLSLYIHRDIKLFANRDFSHLVAHACHVNFAHNPKIEKIGLSKKSKACFLEFLEGMENDVFRVIKQSHGFLDETVQFFGRLRMHHCIQIVRKAFKRRTLVTVRNKMLFRKRFNFTGFFQPSVVRMTRFRKHFIQFTFVARCSSLV